MYLVLFLHHHPGRHLCTHTLPFPERFLQNELGPQVGQNETDKEQARAL